jgi:Arc/MetJ-type ribon-helix-helix transcriptional regulator
VHVLEYDQRPEPGESPGPGTTPLPSARDALAPYLSATEAGPFTKLSISLPEPLIATVREVSDQTGVSVSGVIAASLRRLLDEVLQARIDAALEEDREENLAWAQATGPGDALLLRDLVW